MLGPTVRGGHPYPAPARPRPPPGAGLVLSSAAVEPDDVPDDADDALRALLPPDDRLWRHPSEVAWAASHAAVGRTPRPTVGVAAMAGVAGALVALAAVAFAGGLGRTVVRERVVERQAVTPLVGTDPTDDVVAIAESAGGSIVRLEVAGPAGSTTGSGVLFRSDGYLLTNTHVVDGAERITVITGDGRSFDGALVGGDAESDIAVVRIGGGDHPVALLGTAVNLRVGERAVAIGSPLGLAGGPSVTAGVVSALGRAVRTQAGSDLRDMIQTDAPIAPGSSGGALLDRAGTVVGITTAVAVTEVGAEGLGFATPIDVARDVATDLIERGRVTRAWLGIEGMDAEPAAVEPFGARGGAKVRKALSSSPAAAAGLLPDDIVVAVGTEPVLSMSALVISLRHFEPGDAVSLEVIRAGTRLRVQCTLSERPASVG